MLTSRIYINKEIRRNGVAWIEEGEYDTLRQFDDTRWIIVLSMNGPASRFRQLTLINIKDFDFV